MRPTKDVDDHGFREAADNCRKLEARKRELQSEYSDIHHQRVTSRGNAIHDQISPEVAELVVGLGDDEDIALQDTSVRRLSEIQEELAIVEKALIRQEAIVADRRLLLERQIRTQALTGHKALAAKVIKHRQEGRRLRQEILAFESEHLGSVPFGWPLESLFDASDELTYSPIDSSGRDTSLLLETRLRDYTK
jgi:hypothetical protein